MAFANPHVGTVGFLTIIDEGGEEGSFLLCTARWLTPSPLPDEPTMHVVASIERQDMGTVWGCTP